MTKQNPITIIRRSCTTGQVVWIYQGPTKKAANQAYRRARLKEQSRVRWWGKRMARRAANIKAFLDELIAALPIVGDLTPAQRQAIRTLQTIADSPPPCDTAFHNHCRTERRRRQRDKEIRRKMREREQQEQAAREAEKNE
ncbi:MAG: hypothetical protein IJV24_07190 [Prevotella sp.]|nr:hypothetical protein [Prevotella sp.]